MDLPFGHLQRSAQRAVEQQHDDKISHAVHGIVGKAAEPPAQGKGRSFCHQIHRRTQAAEAQAVDAAEHRPAKGIVHPAQQPCQQRQQIPHGPAGKELLPKVGGRMGQTQQKAARHLDALGQRAGQVVKGLIMNDKMQINGKLSQKILCVNNIL